MDVYRDYKELLSILNACRVKFIVVGAHAVAYHTEPRYTKDLDILVERSAENAARTWEALRRFGAPLSNVTAEDFAKPDVVYQMGIEPVRVDVMTGIEGVSFDTAWRNRVQTVYAGVNVYVLGRADLIRNKRAAGRPQDLLDVRRLVKPVKRQRRK